MCVCVFSCVKKGSLFSFSLEIPAFLQTAQQPRAITFTGNVRLNTESCVDLTGDRGTLCNREQHGVIQPRNLSAAKRKDTLLQRQEGLLDGRNIDAGCSHMSPWSSWAPATIYCPLASSLDHYRQRDGIIFSSNCLPSFGQAMWEEFFFLVTLALCGHMRIRHQVVTDVTRSGPRGSRVSITVMPPFIMREWLFQLTHEQLNATFYGHSQTSGVRCRSARVYRAVSAVRKWFWMMKRMMKRGKDVKILCRAQLSELLSVDDSHEMAPFARQTASWFICLPHKNGAIVQLCS